MPHKLLTEESFRIKLDRTIKPPFNDNIILADSVNISDSVIYYQGNQVNTIGKNLADETGIQIRKKFYLLGTDEYGRDVFARLIYGSRVSITVGLSAVVLSFIIGIILGFIAGYRGGFIDIILNRFTEMFLAFPVIYLIVLILALFGSSIFSVIIVLGISGWMNLFKIVKTEVLSIKQKDFFASAELIGLKNSLLLKKKFFLLLFIRLL
ncbi:MAG: ABC transporter permease [Ignavibacteriaceae bacterium]|nr:ABC transporter permease [Ignavibacteriaceae bacterium]